MTEEQVLSLCFSNRGVDFSDLEELLEEDLKYSKGDTVYFRPLKEILANPRVFACEYTDDCICIHVDEENTCKIPLDQYDKPKVIRDFETDYVYTTTGSITVNYYLFAGGWADEYMLTSKKPIRKKEVLLNSIRSFHEIY